MQFIPCGITDAGVTTISEQLGRTVTPADILGPLERELIKYQDRLAMPFEPLVPQEHKAGTRDGCVATRLKYFTLSVLLSIFGGNPNRDLCA